MLSVPGKVYGRILIERAIENSEGQVGDEQGGFEKGRSCADQIFVLGQICEKMKENKKRVGVAFMDLEKAYDRVDRDAIWQAMRIPSRWLNHILMVTFMVSVSILLMLIFAHETLADLISQNFS